MSLEHQGEVQLVKDIQPRLVTLPELRAALLPYTAGFAWGEKAIVDLWEMGAPAPQDVCVCGWYAKDPRRCNCIRRVLLPAQFARWWAEVVARF
jgi:hypothetical protein